MGRKKTVLHIRNLISKINKFKSKTKTSGPRVASVPYYQPLLPQPLLPLDQPLLPRLWPDHPPPLLQPLLPPLQPPPLFQPPPPLPILITLIILGWEDQPLFQPLLLLMLLPQGFELQPLLLLLPQGFELQPLLLPQGFELQPLLPPIQPLLRISPAELQANRALSTMKNFILESLLIW